MGGKSIATSETKIEALKLQSSAYGVTIPVVGGVTRIPGNLIYYSDFTAVPTTESRSGKGGVKTTNTTYSYNASVLMALCHGQINSIPRIWVGKRLYGDDPGSVTTTTYTESIAIGPSSTATVAHAAAFSAHIDMTATTGWGQDVGSFTLAEGVDFTVTAGVYTFGPSVPSATGTVRYQGTTTNSGNALQKLAMSLFPGTLSQSPASWVSTRHSAEALPYAGLAYVSADAYALGQGAQVENHNFEVVGPGAFSLGALIADIDPSMFSVKLLQDARYGARLPSGFFQTASDWSDYCLANDILMSPALVTQMKAADFLDQMATLTNTGIVWSDGRVQMRPYGDTAATGINGVTYTPNVTPQYDLTDDVYIQSSTTPPVVVTRKQQSDCHNHVRVQFQNRANQYAKEIAEAKDQADIEINGLRSAEIVNADWICDATVARNVAQLLLQRSLYVRDTYEFSLPWNFAFLEPMDLVTITDNSAGGLGLTQVAVRITNIEEDGEAALKFTAESFALGVANAAVYNTQVGAGFIHDFNVLPGSVTTHFLFEAPVPLTANRLEVLVAATGTGQYWGGCRVWGSLDGLTYREIGKISGGSRGGTLTTTMTAGATTTGVAILTGALTSGSAVDASNLTTLCYIGGANPEYVGFETATLTSALHYTLAGLHRGGYGSVAASHSIGDPFVRVDDTVVRTGPLDAALIGSTVHVKFTSFNVFGLAEEDIASVPDYTYTIAGTFANAAPAAITGLSATAVPGGITLACTLPANTSHFTVTSVNLYEGTTNVFGSAVLYTHGLAATFTRMNLQASDGVRYYWVAPVDQTGGYDNIGPLAGPVSATALDPTGMRTALLTLYQWAGSAPVTFPVGTSTYTWASATFTDPATLNGWTQSPGAGSTGQSLYACRQAYSDTLTTATSTVTWSASTSIVMGGAGTTGATGGTGAAGTRGSRNIYPVSASYTSSYNDGSGAGAPSYKNQSTILIASVTAGTTPTTPIKGDTVTFTNGSNYVTTYTNDGTYGSTGNASWALPGTVIDGSLLVSGSVTASKINVVNLSALTADLGTVTAGTISGTANLSIAGQATISGNTNLTVNSVARDSALHVNGSYSSNVGITAYTNYGSGGAVALNGFAFSGGIAVSGNVTGGTGGSGVYGIAQGSGKSGMTASGYTGADALTIVGTTSINNSTITWNGYSYAAPGGSTTTFMRNDGTWANPIASLAKGLVYLTTGTPISTTIAGYIKVQSQDGTVGPVYMPYCTFP